MRRQDNRSSGPVNKPVFEEGGQAKKDGGFVRSTNNGRKTDPRNDGQRSGEIPTPVLRTSYDKSSNESSFNSNQDRRDGYDNRMRRPTKVFVTSGPIGGPIPAVKTGDRSFVAIDQQRQRIDSRFDDRGTRDGQQIGLGDVKGRPRAQADKTAQDVKPYFGARRDRDRGMTQS